MAGDFKAGEGRVEFTGDASQLKAVTTSVKDDLLKMEQQAAGKLQSRSGFAAVVEQLGAIRRGAGHVLQAFLGWSAIIGLITGAAGAIYGLVTSLDRARERSQKLHDDLQTLFADRPSGIQAELDAVDDKFEKYRKKVLDEESRKKVADALILEADKKRDAEKNRIVDREVSRQVEADEEKRRNRIKSINDQIKAEERSRMTADEREAADRKDQEEEIAKLEQAGLNEAEKQEVAALKARLAKLGAIKKKDKEHSERVSLEDLAGKFDLSNVSRAAASTTQAVNKQTEVMKRMGQGTVIKD